MGAELWIGLISGTSADAVDAALVEIGPRPSDLRVVAVHEEPIDEELRERIPRASSAPLALRDLLALDVEIGVRFAAAAEAVRRAAGVARERVRGIGSHGQTIAHHPETGVRGSLQIGDPSVIHERSRLPVIADFRRADLAAGGQGAPLTPFLHHALLAREGERRAVLNVGGFTNLTYLPGLSPDDVIAFDPGPGNALLDRAARRVSEGRERYDRDGQRAARGRVVAEALDALLQDPYFERPPPKSTGHEHFDLAFFERARQAIERAGGGGDDLFATLLALTVESVGRSAERFLPEPPERWIVYGGGARNPELVARIRARVAPAPLESSQAHGLPPDALEAATFALLGWCAAHGHPGNLPAATGAERRVVLGSATPPFGRCQPEVSRAG